MSNGTPKKSTNYLSAGLKVLVGVSLVGALGWYAGLEASLDALRHSRPLPAFAAFCSILVSVCLAGTGVLVLGRAVSPELPWVDGFRGFLRAWALGFFFGRVSELSLPVFWRQHLTLGQSAAVVLVDKLISLAWIVALGSVGLALLFEPLLGLAVACIAGAPLIFALLAMRFGWARALVVRMVPSAILDRLGGMMDTVRVLGTRGLVAVAINIGITGVRSVVHGVFLLSLVNAVGGEVPLGTAVLIQAQTQLASMIPGSVMGLGFWESIYIVALGRVGVMASTALAAALLGRVASLAVLLPGLLFAWDSGVSQQPDPAP